MSSNKLVIPFFTDNDVDDDVGEFLKESGHKVTRLREIMLTDSPDPVVAAACREQGMVLITHNVKHFRRIARTYEVTKGEVERLCRVELACLQVDAVERMREEMPIIELEWSRLGPEKAGLRIYIGKAVTRVHRR